MKISPALLIAAGLCLAAIAFVAIKPMLPTAPPSAEDAYWCAVRHIHEQHGVPLASLPHFADVTVSDAGERAFRISGTLNGADLSCIVDCSSGTPECMEVECLALEP